MAGAVTRVPGGPPCHLGVVQHASRLRQEGGAGVRQRDAPLASIEQPHPKLVLELADLFADSWLRYVQPLGGAAEMQLLGDRDEVAKLA